MPDKPETEAAEEPQTTEEHHLETLKEMIRPQPLDLQNKVVGFMPMPEIAPHLMASMLRQEFQNERIIELLEEVVANTTKAPRGRPPKKEG